MGLPTSQTLTIGTPPTAVVFDDAVKVGNSVVYSAVSPQGDITGRPTLRVSQETTKAGIMRTLVSFNFPYWDSVKGVYDGSTTANLVLSRKTEHKTVNAATAIEAMHELMALAGWNVPIAIGVI